MAIRAPDGAKKEPFLRRANDMILKLKILIQLGPVVRRISMCVTRLEQRKDMQDKVMMAGYQWIGDDS